MLGIGISPTISTFAPLGIIPDAAIMALSPALWLDGTKPAYSDLAGTTVAANGESVANIDAQSQYTVTQSLVSARPMRIENGFKFSIDDFMVFSEAFALPYYVCVIQSPNPTWNTYGSVVDVSGLNTDANGVRVARPRMSPFQTGGNGFYADSLPVSVRKNSVGIMSGGASSQGYFILGGITQKMVLSIEPNAPLAVRKMNLGAMGEGAGEASYRLNFNLYQLVGFSVKPSLPDIQKIEEALAVKCGVTS